MKSYYLQVEITEIGTGTNWEFVKYWFCDLHGNKYESWAKECDFSFPEGFNEKSPLPLKSLTGVAIVKFRTEAGKRIYQIDADILLNIEATIEVAESQIER
jgi:hypothetical protein